MENCEKCGKPLEEGHDCEKKYLDEEDVLKELEEEGPEETEEPEETPEEPEKPEEPEEPEKPDLDWQEQASEHGWVPDHVREKHAREAQTLRDQNTILQRMLDAREEEPVDPNEVVRQGDLENELTNLRQNIDMIRDPAVLSEMMLRTQVNDYDEVIIQHVEPLAAQNPWLESVLRGKSNPAKAAYDLGCALRDGRKVGFDFEDGEMVIKIEETELAQPKPKPKDPSRPPVEALEQAQKQPKSLDEIPTAKETDAVEMSVEEFWKLPSDTLMRMRMEKPELYNKMREKFNEKYG